VTPPVLIIRHDAVERPGRITRALEGAGLSHRVVRVDRREPVPHSPGDAPALVVMGGPMGVYQADRYPHLNDEVRLIQLALERGRPVLGICLGSQLLAHALGARVYPGPGKEIGWYDITLSPAAGGDPLWRDVASPFPAFVWHGDVFDLPPGATPLAASALTPVQAFAAGGNTYGLLFHLEVDAGQVKDMCRAFKGELAEEKIDPATLVAGAARHLPAATGVGDTVFSRWAAGVADAPLRH
jgi:GMP synthase (glutamine-hydrolysing)